VGAQTRRCPRGRERPRPVEIAPSSAGHHRVRPATSGAQLACGQVQLRSWYERIHRYRERNGLPSAYAKARVTRGRVRADPSKASSYSDRERHTELTEAIRQKCNETCEIRAAPPNSKTIRLSVSLNRGRRSHRTPRSVPVLGSAGADARVRLLMAARADFEHRLRRCLSLTTAVCS